MPKFLSEESRQRWTEAVRRTKATKQIQQAAPGNGLPVPQDDKVAVVAAIDLMLRRLEVDRAALERAREILSR